jgi:hypothetical protein
VGIKLNGKVSDKDTLASIYALDGLPERKKKNTPIFPSFAANGP